MQRTTKAAQRRSGRRGRSGSARRTVPGKRSGDAATARARKSAPEPSRPTTRAERAAAREKVAERLAASQPAPRKKSRKTRQEPRKPATKKKSGKQSSRKQSKSKDREKAKPRKPQPLPKARDLVTSKGVAALFRGHEGTGVVLQVASVRRYGVDADFLRLVDASPSTRYAFDVALHDAHHSVRAVLSPSINHLVFTGRLTVGSLFRVADYEIRTEETLIAERRVLVIRSGEPLNRQVDPLMHESRPLLGSLASTFDRRLVETERPLAGHRFHYLPMSSDDCMELVDGWNREAVRGLGDSEGPILSINSETLASPRHPSLADIASGSPSWPGDDETGRMIIGRVGAVGRLVYFGRPDKRQACPFRFSFSLSDASRTLKVVVWNRAAARYHSALLAAPWGALVGITGYRMKSYGGEREISVNAENPTGSIEWLDDSTIARLDSRTFPSPALNFVATKRVPKLHSGATFDVAGVASHVGEIVREPLWDNRGGDRTEMSDPAVGPGFGASHAVPDGPWYQYRWVVIRDPSSQRELHVKLYANSQPRGFEGLRPGYPVTLTAVTLVGPPPPGDLPPPTEDDDGIIDTPSGDQRPVFAVSSTMTRLLSARDTLRLAGASKRLQDVLQEFRTLKSKGALATLPDDPSRIAAGDYVPYLQRPPTLRMYCVLVLRSLRYVPATPVAELPAYMSSLHVQQLRRLLVVGTITDLRTPAGRRGGGRKPGRSTESSAHAGAAATPIARRTRRSAGAKRSRESDDEEEQLERSTSKKTGRNTRGKGGGGGAGAGAGKATREEEDESESSGDESDDGYAVTIAGAAAMDSSGSGAETKGEEQRVSVAKYPFLAPAHDVKRRKGRSPADQLLSRLAQVLPPNAPVQSLLAVSEWCSGRRLAFGITLTRRDGRRVSVGLESVYDLTADQ